MINLMTDISKYIMVLLMAVCTYLNFRYFGVEEEIKDRLCGRQLRLMFLMHLLAYLVMYGQTGDVRILMFYGIQVVFFLLYNFLTRLFYRNVSRILLNNLCLLLCTGFIMLTRLSLNRAVRQFTIAVAAAVITWVIPAAMAHVWQLGKISWVYGIVGIVLLLVVFVAGDTSYGAKLSINVGGLSLQFSEFVKITFVFFIASMLYQATDTVHVAAVTLTAVAHVLILALSKDLGSAFLFLATYLSMLLVATLKGFFLSVGMLWGCGGAALAIVLCLYERLITVLQSFFSYVKVRFEAWQNPWADIENKGYQIAQSLFAIGTGSWFGMGLYQGMPWKIPVVEKDFIFAALSEELGAVFALCVLLLYLGCFLQFMMIACRMQASFYKLLAFGLGILFILQIFLNVGGVIKFIPSTGVTLPLISYGGSSVSSTFITFGVIQGLYILKKNEEEEYEAGL